MDIFIDSDCTILPKETKPLVSQGSLIENFLVGLGYEASDPPLAELLKGFYSLEGDCLMLSPVKWQATHNDAMIIAADETLALEEAESKHWFTLYKNYLAEENIGLYYHDAKTWVLQAKGKPSLHAKPTHLLINQSLMPELAQLDSTLYWQKFLTEAQMFFASQPSIPPFNGVWLWGSAPLRDKTSLALCADESFFSIAQLCAEQVTLYHPTLELNSFSMLLLKSQEGLSASHQEQLKKIPSTWYWNNKAYRSTFPNYFARVWRNIFHVD